MFDSEMTMQGTIKGIIGALIGVILIGSFVIPTLLDVSDNAGYTVDDAYSYTPEWGDFVPVTITTTDLPSFLTWDGTTVSGTLMEEGKFTYTITGVDDEDNTKTISKSIQVSKQIGMVRGLIVLVPVFILLGIIVLYLRGGFGGEVSMPSFGSRR